MDTHAPHTVVVVSHTHWDREWYHPLGRMQQRLAALVDALLDDRDGLPFLLDGQAIVLDDYRAMRPERAEHLSAALRAGEIEAGPWYVLPDLLLPGGEALVRNLLEGSRTVREAGGAPPPVLYSPDAFGHSGAGPVLAHGFGLDTAIVWRGFGGPEHPDGTVAWWAHPGGAGVVLYHLPPSGYEIGASLPVADSAASFRWRSMRDAVLGNNPLRIALLPNGADHHARQEQRRAALATLARVAEPHDVIPGTLASFAHRLRHAATGVELPVVTGELRDSSGWTWSLQGTFATRAYQKRTNAQVERLLVREAEPWAALAWFTRGWRQGSVRAAWRMLLSAQPHDTLCGCCHDDIARAADQRWADARVLAEAVREDALGALVGYDGAQQRELEANWRPTLVLRNPAARARGGVARLRLVDAVIADPVGPGSAARSGARVNPPAAPIGWSGDEHLQLVQRTRQFDRVESSQHYPRNAVVRVTEVLAWVPPVHGYGVQPVMLAELSALVQATPVKSRVRASDTELSSAAWRISSTMQGLVATHLGTGARVNAVGWLESTTDAGDTYTPSLRGAPVVSHWSAPKMQVRGPLRVEWELAAAFERPATAIAPATDPVARDLPSREAAEVMVTAGVALQAGAEWIEVSIRGDNRAGDHRLRWILPLPGSIHTDRVIADAAFGAIERRHVDRDPREWSPEQRLPTAPLHRWLHLTGEAYGLGIVSDGLAEYELLPGGHLAITLLRAVGELSRRDVVERPGHAGWPLPTPMAQCRGPFEARFAIVILPADRDAAQAMLEATADDVLHPITGDTLRGVGTLLHACEGLTLEGKGLAFSAARRSEDGQWLVLRCINQCDAAVRGVWHLPRAASEVRLSRLDETPGIALTGTGSRIRFEAPPNGVVTLLVR
ncbi:MAG: hypothetical protein IT355_09235 [Gemmatimonadaceae bacterium]|nr:hypothetical protein [Gemmatimonadaceae bacterium]